MKKIILIGLSLLTFFGCKKEKEEPVADFVIGKNRFTTLIDGDEREYYVHVPLSYNADTPVPVVFMLHGTSGDGERFYNISGWRQLGEEENLLTVYPSSWRYCIFNDEIDGQQVKHTTKWNVFPGSFEYCPNEVPRDDIKFLRQIISELNERFNVDNKRIHLAGFSNGGQMAFRCAVEMSDVFASIVESAGSFTRDSLFLPKRDLPITFQVGNTDNKWFGQTTVGMQFFQPLLDSLPKFQRLINVHVNSFHFEPQYTVSGDSTVALRATFQATPQGERNFNILLINGLDHHYPNGSNHPLEGARLNWEWMKQYSLP